LFLQIKVFGCIKGGNRIDTVKQGVVITFL